VPNRDITRHREKNYNDLSWLKRIIAVWKNSEKEVIVAYMQHQIGWKVVAKAFQKSGV